MRTGRTVEDRAHAGTARRPAGFTLIELMIVIAMIGILMAVVFRLMGTIGAANKRAITMARIQRLENALAGFHAEYGTYPPVALHNNPNPLKSWDEGSGSYKDAQLSSSSANHAARSQPVAFEYPARENEDEIIRKYFRALGRDVVSANVIMDSFDKDKPKWEDVKLFKFGLLSYLVPRLVTIGSYDSNGLMLRGPRKSAFDKKQWQAYNMARYGAFADQLSREEIACARWMPNLEGIIDAGPTIAGIRTESGYPSYYATYKHSGSGVEYALRRITTRDAWERELYYYSAPPYQSYRIWSAGPDGNTFPPGFNQEDLTTAQRKQVADWTTDDIVGFDK